MKIKIESDGTSKRTTVKNVKTGEVLEHITGVDVIIRINKPVVAKITFSDVEVDIIGEVKDGAI